ncbi:hypothetical protein AVEN_60967-1 [Araneus ventricosus]|uniref:Reverse transcriptase/retrotransposon-derived protein RNase H-like domain-containing protein n=1 Tax=Araneus ventricosus TaxID=182803 RepID=A0A4Y2DDN5_ARAVE|nr:hypothetical protein AVEN_60967-1 [Araneus ventricosus]
MWRYTRRDEQTAEAKMHNRLFKAVNIKRKIPSLMLYSMQIVRKTSEQLKWNENAEQAFIDAKNAIAEATLLRHTIPGARLSLWVEASDVAMGATLSKLSQEQWEPIAFYLHEI